MISANLVMDMAGVAVGIASLILFGRSYRYGPEAYRRPLGFFLAGLFFIVVSFLFSAAIPVFGFNHAIMELWHHIFLTAGVSLFVFSGLQFLKIGR